MSRPEAIAREICARLAADGFTAYFAGGCVRDRLLGYPPGDIDIATDARPEDVRRIFRRTVAVGAHFGVVVVVEGGHQFEVATFRSDGAYVDGRRPESVEFTTAEGDASRRDFTINGLFFDPAGGEVLDFVGGRADLERRVIRAIGDASARFREDRLRVLRGIRFAASLGFEIEDATWRALVDAAPGIGAVSAERVRDELVKMFVAPGRLRAFDLLDRSGLLARLLPEVDALKGCEQPPQFHPEGDVFVHTRLMFSLLEGDVSPALAFAVLLHDIGKPPCASVDPTGRIRFNGHEHRGAIMAEAVARRLRFSNAETTAITEMVRNHMAFKDTPNMRLAKLRRFLARPHFDDELELHRVDCLGSHGGLDIHAFLLDQRARLANEPLVPPRLLTGADLIALGWKPGPHFRTALETAQNLQLEGRLQSKEDAIEWARAQTQSGGDGPGPASRQPG